MNMNLFSSSFYSDLIPFSFDSHSSQRSLSIHINREHPFDYHVCSIDEPTEEPIVSQAVWLHLLPLRPHSLPSRLRSSSAGKISHRWPTTVTYSLELKGMELSAIAQVDKELELSSKSQCQRATWNTESERVHLMCLMICKIAPLGVYLSNTQQEKF